MGDVTPNKPNGLVASSLLTGMLHECHCSTATRKACFKAYRAMSFACLEVKLSKLSRTWPIVIASLFFGLAAVICVDSQKVGVSMRRV